MERSYFLDLDTETCNTPKIDGKLCMNCGCVYNLGYAIVDKYGNIYDRKSFIISDVFFGMADLMKSAYYAEKIPQYLEGIENGLYEVVDFFTARNILLNDIEKWNVKAVIAHNARFDVAVLNSTLRVLTGMNWVRFLPNIDIWDTLMMARQTICKQKTYCNWCERNGYVTKNGRPRATAEVLYRYISCNDEFEEAHTALADVEIETVILAKCIAQHKKMRKVLYKAEG